MEHDPVYASAVSILIVRVKNAGDMKLHSYPGIFIPLYIYILS